MKILVEAKTLGGIAEGGCHQKDKVGCGFGAWAEESQAASPSWLMRSA
jgi:hypothetical protein